MAHIDAIPMLSYALAASSGCARGTMDQPSETDSDSDSDADYGVLLLSPDYTNTGTGLSFITEIFAGFSDVTTTW